MNHWLKGQTAWITGASRGIGKAIALMFATHGAKVILCARTEEALSNTFEQTKQLSGEEPILLAYDVTDTTQSDEAFRKLCKQIKKLDVLVNNAGILDDALVGMITQSQICSTLGTNTEAIIRHTQYATRLMRKGQKREHHQYQLDCRG